MKAFYQTILFICVSIASLQHATASLTKANPLINSCSECDCDKDRK